MTDLPERKFRKPSVSRTNVRVMWDMLKARGEQPVSVKCFADGSFEIVCKKSAPDTNSGNEWDVVLPGHGSH